MANTIQLKRSSVASNIPTIGQLSLGELGINTFDGKLFLKKDNGTQSIVEIGTGGGGGGLTNLDGGIAASVYNPPTGIDGGAA